MAEIFYDAQNGHALQLIEERKEGTALYKDMDEALPTFIICRTATVDVYPRKPCAAAKPLRHTYQQHVRMLPPPRAQLAAV